jgi:hypothetical protein
VTDPDRYADSIVQAHRRRTREIPSEQIPATLRRSADAFDIVPVAKSIDDGLEGIISELYKECLSSIRPEFQRLCTDCARVRCVPSNDVEGYISRSSDGSYAIIITTGFMTFLNKIIKIDLAIADPSLVEYCDRCSIEALDRGTLEKFRDEIVRNFRSHDARGPVVVFKEKAETMTGRAILLHLQEKFVICHEIGHLISEFFLHGLLPSMLGSSYGSDKHRAEYAADVLGFAILRQQSMIEKFFGGKAVEQSDDQFRLSAICQFFEILGLASPNASESHPSPHDRVCNLIATYYGNSFADHYHAWRSGKVADLNWESCWQKGKAPATTAALFESLAVGTELSPLSENC